MIQPTITPDISPPFGRALVSTADMTSWHWRDRSDDEAYFNGVQAWVFALRGELRGIDFLKAEHFRTHDFVMVNLDYNCIDKIERVVPQKQNRSAVVVALFEGELAHLRAYWQRWSRVADRCDLVVSINRLGTSTLESLTSTPVSYVGIPYPLDGVRKFSVPIAERSREILLCADLLERPPLDYLAARPLALPMYGYVGEYRRNWSTVIRHKSFDKDFNLHSARSQYSDGSLTVRQRTIIQEFFGRAARSILWMNLETRHTWGRFVIDAAALGIPIITTRETGHGDMLFPELVVDSPYDVASARSIARRLLEDSEHYRSVIEHAEMKLDWFRPESALSRLRSALLEAGVPAPS